MDDMWRPGKPPRHPDFREASNSYNPIVVDDMVADARDDDVIDLTRMELGPSSTPGHYHHYGSGIRTNHYPAVHDVEQIRAQKDFHATPIVAKNPRDGSGPFTEDELIEVESTTSSIGVNFSDVSGVNESTYSNRSTSQSLDGVEGARILSNRRQNEDDDAVRVIDADDLNERHDLNLSNPYRMGELHGDRLEPVIERPHNHGEKSDQVRGEGVVTSINHRRSAALSDTSSLLATTSPHGGAAVTKEVRGYERFGNKYRRAVAQRKAQEQQQQFGNVSAPVQQTLWTRPSIPQGKKVSTRDVVTTKRLDALAAEAVSFRESESPESNPNLASRSDVKNAGKMVGTSEIRDVGTPELTASNVSKEDPKKGAKGKTESQNEPTVTKGSGSENEKTPDSEQSGSENEKTPDSKESGSENEKTSDSSKEVKERRLKVLQKARAVLSSPKAGEIKEMNEKRRAAAEVKDKDAGSSDDDSHAEDKAKLEETEGDELESNINMTEKKLGTERDEKNSTEESSDPPIEPDGSSIQELMDRETEVIAAKSGADPPTSPNPLDPVIAPADTTEDSKASSLDDEDKPPTEADGDSGPPEKDVVDTQTSGDSENKDFYAKISESLFSAGIADFRSAGPSRTEEHVEQDNTGVSETEEPSKEQDKGVESEATDLSRATQDEKSDLVSSHEPDTTLPSAEGHSTTHAVVEVMGRLDEIEKSKPAERNDVRHDETDNPPPKSDIVEIHGIPLSQEQLADKRLYTLPKTARTGDAAHELNLTSEPGLHELQNLTTGEHLGGDEEHVTAFDRLRETLMQLDVAGSSSSSEAPSEKNDGNENRLAASPALPIHPILSEYSQDLAYSSSNIDGEADNRFAVMTETNLEDNPSLKAYSRLGEATRTAMIEAESQVQHMVDSNPPHYGILKNADDEAHLHVHFGASPQDSVENLYANETEEADNTTTGALNETDGSRFTPKELDQGTAVDATASSAAVKKSDETEHGGKSTGGARLETAAMDRAAEESDGNTMDDTESKISLISYLGSEDSDLDTNFESSTVPLIVKMLDQGCAWLEGTNCGFESPSLLRESKAKTANGGSGKSSLLPQSGNFSGKNLGRKKSALAQKYNQTKKAAEEAAQSKETKGEDAAQEKESKKDKVEEDIQSEDNETLSMHEDISKIEEIRAAASDGGDSPQSPKLKEVKNGETFDTKGPAEKKEKKKRKKKATMMKKSSNSKDVDFHQNPEEKHRVGDEDSDQLHPSTIPSPTQSHFPDYVVDEETVNVYDHFTGEDGMNSENQIDLTDEGTGLDSSSENKIDLTNEGIHTVVSPSNDLTDDGVRSLVNPSNDPPEVEEEEHVSPDPQEIITYEEDHSHAEEEPKRSAVDPAPSLQRKSPILEATHDTPSARVKSSASEATQDEWRRKAKSSQARKAGGPESSPRRRSKSPKPHSPRKSPKSLTSDDAEEPSIDPQMFVNLTDEERLAALELAERLKRRAEKLKRRRKKREKKMKGKLVPTKQTTFDSHEYSVSTKSAEVSTTA